MAKENKNQKNEIQRIDFDVTYEQENLEYCVIYDKRDHRSEEVLDYINKTNKECSNVQEFLFKLSLRKGIICLPTENADILEVWIKNSRGGLL